MKTYKVQLKESLSFSPNDTEFKVLRMQGIRKESKDAQSYILASVPILLVSATLMILLDAYNAAQMFEVVTSVFLAGLLFVSVFGLFVFLGKIFEFIDNEEIKLIGGSHEPPYRIAS